LATPRVRPMQAAIWNFYPINQNELIESIERCFTNAAFGPGRLPRRGARASEGPVVSGVAPHAGYEFSGPCAAHLYLEIGERVPQLDTVVIIGSNHSGYGGTFTTTRAFAEWATPLGKVSVDMEFVDSLLSRCPLVVDDVMAHLREHSIEVQLPFLQYIYGNNFRIVPIVAKHVELGEARDLAKAIDDIATSLGRNIVLIASSDFTHHGVYYGYVLFRENVIENVKKLDMNFISAILSLDTRRFLNLIRRYDATVCGYGAIAVAMEYSRLRGCTQGKLLRYYNSGELTGDEDMVVGYAAISFEPAPS